MSPRVALRIERTQPFWSVEAAADLVLSMRFRERARRRHRSPRSTPTGPRTALFRRPSLQKVEASST